MCWAMLLEPNRSVEETGKRVHRILEHALDDLRDDGQVILGSQSRFTTVAGASPQGAPRACPCVAGRLGPPARIRRARRPQDEWPTGPCGVPKQPRAAFYALRLSILTWVPTGLYWTWSM